MEETRNSCRSKSSRSSRVSRGTRSSKEQQEQQQVVFAFSIAAFINEPREQAVRLTPSEWGEGAYTPGAAKVPSRLSYKLRVSSSTVRLSSPAAAAAANAAWNSWGVM